jgi:hypothetical protein
MNFRKPNFSYANIDVRIFPLLAFLIPLTVRVLPEIVMGRYIVGFDTVSYYVPVTLRWVSSGVGLFEFLACAPLFYSFLALLTLAGAPLTVTLKVLPPILHGFLGLTIYLYAKRGLAWSHRKSLLVSCLATLYFVALRISWDMLRSELGLIFLFLFLTVFRENLEKTRWKNYALLLPIMILVVLSHLLVAVIMFAIISMFVLQKLFSHEYVAAKHLVLSSIPGMALFGLVIYANFAVSSNFSVISSYLNGESSGWFSLFGFSSYSGMVVNTLGFVLYCYLPLLPFTWFGIRSFKNSELKVWFLWCLAAVLSLVVSPYAFIPGGYRWTLLMVFPMAFLVAENFWRPSSRFLKKILGGILVLLSFSFVFLTADMAFPYFGTFSYYVPSSMLQNSVPLRDCEDVVNALSWVGNNLGSNGILLTHDAFNGWALLFFDKNQIVCYGYENPENAAREVYGNGHDRLCLIWWVPGEGWHGCSTLPSCFVEVFRSNRIAVYLYNSTV